MLLAGSVGSLGTGKWVMVDDQTEHACVVGVDPERQPIIACGVREVHGGDLAQSLEVAIQIRAIRLEPLVVHEAVVHMPRQDAVKPVGRRKRLRAQEGDGNGEQPHGEHQRTADSQRSR